MKSKDLPKCPIETTLKMLGCKWKVLIIRELLTGTKRFCELKKSVTGITQKVLTSKLRELEELLPRYFTRISKSCILNLKHVTSMKKSISGVCEIYLCGETKKVYASRMYYKAFRDKLTETRL